MPLMACGHPLPRGAARPGGMNPVIAMKKAFLALLLAVLLRPASAPADFLFPSSLTSLGDEAFAGAALPAFLTLPDTLESLGEGVFRGCTALREITIPASVTSIGEGALSGCGDALWVHCAPGSAARAYAAASGLDWDADTVYRAGHRANLHGHVHGPQGPSQ